MTLARATDQLVGRSFGEFVVRERIGEGGFGAVYRANQRALDREAVIKVLHARLSSSSAKERFLREARLASKLDHPYAAHIYAFGAEADGQLWIAMELVRGTPLDKILHIQGPLTLERFVPLLDRICEVVHTAHEQGIIHRDIKPANVMVLSRAGRLLPKLLDFGIAKGLDTAASSGSPAGPLAELDHTMPGIDSVDLGDTQPSDITQHGAVMGSPPYIAPEQWLDAGDVDARTDLYALGILAFECLTGRQPFTGTTLTAYAHAHASQPPPSVGDGFPPAIDAVLAKVLAKQPQDRYPDALTFATAFRQAAGITVEPTKLPALDPIQRDAAINHAPQPIAEAVAALDAARNAHQLRDAMVQVARTITRHLGLLALACRSRIMYGGDPGAAADLMRALGRRSLYDREWLELGHGFTRTWVERRDAYPVPELVDVFHGDRTVRDDLVALFELREHDVPTEGVLVDLLDKAIANVANVLDTIAFVRDYPLVVTSAGGVAERWMGVRRAQRPTMVVRDKALPPGVPALLDDAGTPVLALAPLFQVTAPTPGAPLEMFMFDGKDRRGAKLVAFPAGFEAHDDALWEWFRVQLATSVDETQSVDSEERAPFRGLAAFSAEDNAAFFGREKQIDAFVNRLKVQPLLAVVGRSGAGKSSFVFAGVIPALGWRAITLRPGPSPLAALVARLEHAGIGSASRATFERDDQALGALLRADAVERGPIMIVVDQLEEMFTLCQDADERRVFAEALAFAARSADDPVRVVFTLRDDFLVRTEQVHALRNRIAQGLQLLTVPVEDDLLRILVEPTRRAGYDFDDRELPKEMVAAVADQPGALALLSFTASKLWELRDRHFRQLTRAAYKLLGGVAGALAHHADETLDAMPPEERALVREAFRHLVTTQNTRAVISRTELDQLLGGNHAVIEKLIAARLLVASENEAGAEIIEIVHEALIGAWPRLVEWRREDADGVRFREQLRTAAKQWDDRKRAKDLLWRGDALADYNRWRARHPGPLTDLEAAFTSASLAAAARGRRNRALALATVIASLVAVVVGLTIFNTRIAGQRKELHDNLERQYEDQGRRRVLEGDPLQALAFLAKAAELGAGGRAHDFLVAQAVRASDGEVLEVHGDLGLLAPRFSSDGKRLVTGGLDHTARVWDAQTGAMLLQLPHADVVRTTRFSPDDATILTIAGNDAVVWDARSGRQLHALHHDGRVRCAVFVSNTVAVTAGDDDAVVIWDVATGAEQKRLHGSGAGFASCAVAPDGTKVAAGDRKGAVFVWELASGQPVHELRGEHTGSVRFVRFSPDNVHLFSSSEEGNTVAWTVADAHRTMRLASEGALNSVDASQDGRSIVTTATDRKEAIMWDAATGERRAVLGGHSAQVWNATFSPDGVYVVTMCSDGSVWLWTTADARVVARWHGHQDAVNDAVFSPSGEHVVTTSLDGRAIVWMVAPQQQSTWLLAQSGGSIDSAGFAPDGRTVVTGSRDGSVRLWDAASGRQLAVTQAHRGSVAAAGFSATGREIATAGADGLVRIWDATTLAPRKVLAETGAVISEASWSPDGTLFVAGNEAGTVRCWDVASGRLKFETPTTGHTLRSATFDSTGTEVVTSGDESVIRIWNLDGTLARSIDDTDSSMHTHVELGRDRSRLLIVSAKQTAKIVRLDRNLPPVRLVGHVGSIGWGTWSPDGSLVVTAAIDGTARIWDATTGDSLAILQHPSVATLATFSPDGNRVLVLGRDGTAALHDLPVYRASPAELERLMRCRVPYEVLDDRLVPRERDQNCARR